MTYLSPKANARPSENFGCNKNKHLSPHQLHILDELRGCSFQRPRPYSCSRAAASACCSHGKSAASTMFCSASSAWRWRLGLEVSKPFAIDGAFRSLRRMEVHPSCGARTCWHAGGCVLAASRAELRRSGEGRHGRRAFQRSGRGPTMQSNVTVALKPSWRPSSPRARPRVRLPFISAAERPCKVNCTRPSKTVAPRRPQSVADPAQSRSQLMPVRSASRPTRSSSAYGCR